MLRGKSDWSPDFVTKDKDKDKECVTRRPDFGPKKRQIGVPSSAQALYLRAAWEK